MTPWEISVPCEASVRRMVPNDVLDHPHQTPLFGSVGRQLLVLMVVASGHVHLTDLLEGEVAVDLGEKAHLEPPVGGNR